jgi:hypothetical protein
MAPLVIRSYGIFFRRKRCLFDLAGGRSCCRYAINAFATAGRRGSSIATLVFGRRALNTPACQSRSSNLSARTSAAPRPYVASSNMIAKSRLPGACDREIECKIFCTSLQGSVRGGCSSMRYRGAITAPARSSDSFPVICKNGRNARSELQVSATVRFASRVLRFRTNASTSFNVVRSTGFILDRSCNRKPRAVSMSRINVPSETPL